MKWRVGFPVDGQPGQIDFEATGDTLGFIAVGFSHKAKPGEEVSADDQ